jgi:hypothetical protein
LYKSGARKFALIGLTALGNIPFERSACGIGSNGSACVDNINNAVQLFNDGLKSTVDQLNSNLTNATFIFINASAIESSPPIGIYLIFLPYRQSATFYSSFFFEKKKKVKSIHMIYLICN